MPPATYFPAPQPAVYPAPAYAPRTPVAAAPRTPAPPQPRTLVRAKGPEEPRRSRPAPLTMPSPEALGVTVRPAQNGPNWTAIHARIKELGIVSFHMDSAPDGRCRFTCWVPQGQPGLTQRIEALAATEADAVQMGLERAGQSRSTHR